MRVLTFRTTYVQGVPRYGRVAGCASDTSGRSTCVKRQSLAASIPISHQRAMSQRRRSAPAYIMGEDPQTDAELSAVRKSLLMSAGFGTKTGGVDVAFGTTVGEHMPCVYRGRPLPARFALNRNGIRKNGLASSVKCHTRWLMMHYNNTVRSDELRSSVPGFLR